MTSITDQVIGKIPTIIALGVLAQTAQRITTGRRPPVQRATEVRSLKAAGSPQRLSARLSVMKRNRNVRADFLDAWYDIDRKSFNRSFKRNNQDGKKMVISFSKDNPQLFNHIWDVKHSQG